MSVSVVSVIQMPVALANLLAEGVLIRGELIYLAPLGSENISAPYLKQCFFQGGGGYYPPDSQTPRLPVPRQK
jgi:hypothetical protein